MVKTDGREGGRKVRREGRKRGKIRREGRKEGREGVVGRGRGFLLDLGNKTKL